MFNNSTQLSRNQTFTNKNNNAECGHFFVDASALSGSLPEYYKTVIQIFSVFNALLSVPAVLGNTVVILLIWKTPSLHQHPGNVLLSLLACSDFLIGSLVQPSFVASHVALLRKQIAKHCATLLLSDVCAWTFGGASFLTLTLVSLDKYIALYYSLRYNNIVTTKRVVYVVLACWTACVSIAPVMLVRVRSITALMYVLPVFLFLIGVNVWCYYKILKVVRRHHFQIRDQASVLRDGVQPAEETAAHTNSLNMARYVKSLSTVFYVAGAFLLCYLPLAVFLIFLQFNSKQMISKHVIPCFLIVAEAIVYLNSTLNPPIYFWRVTRLRRAAVGQLRKIRKFNSRQIDTQPTVSLQ